MGLSASDLRKSRLHNEFDRNAFPNRALQPISRCRSVPVVSRYGGSQQGQNRDKFSNESTRKFWMAFCVILGMAAARGRDSAGYSGRGKRRGLPSEDALRELASTYLELHAELWPDVAIPGLGHGKTNKKILAEMISRFQDAFLDDQSRPTRLTPATLRAWKLAAIYLRYSDDNSNPRSLAQQLRNCLIAAARENVYVPWELVFADAAVTGTIAARRGYEQFKAVIFDRTLGVEVGFVDDLSRLARDSAETMLFRRQLKSTCKRIISVGDNIDSSDRSAGIVMGVKGFLQEEFIEDLRYKVDRGMLDAFYQGRNIRSVCIGYKLVPTTENGDLVISAKGKVLRHKVIDDDQAAIVREAFELYAAGTSTTQIARLFNDRKAAGKSTWCASAIVQILTRRIYAGEEVDGVRSSRQDPVTGKKTCQFVPEDQWRRRPAEHLRIVSDELWHKVQNRRQACSEAFKARRPSVPGRASLYPKLLFRPQCSYCGTELILGHSGTNPSFFCSTGHDHRKNCRVYGYKAVSIIDRALLAYASLRLIDDAAVKALVRSANQHLKVEAAKPTENVAELRAELRKVESRLKQLIAVADLCDEAPAEIARKLNGINSEKAELEKRIQVASAPKKLELKSLKECDVREMLNSLRGLLATDVKASAPVLRALFGPIKVRILDELDERGKPAWELSFDWSLARGITQISLENGHPTRALLEFLLLRGWTSSEPQAIRLERPKTAQKWAATVQAMAAKGASCFEICRITGLGGAEVQKAMKLQITDADPPPVITWLGGDGTSSRPAKYKKIARRVQQLRDVEQLTFKQIAVQITEEIGEKTSSPTAIKAYNYACREKLAADFQDGKPHRPRSVRGIRPAVIKKMHLMLKRGDSRIKIARELKCSVKVVGNEKRLLKERGLL